MCEKGAELSYEEIRKIGRSERFRDKEGKKKERLVCDLFAYLSGGVKS